MKKIWLSSPHLGVNERKYVNEVFDSNWIAPLGAFVDGFEDDLEKYTGVKYAVALSSGTAAIHLSLLQLGVESGDEVLCQSFTFSGTCNPIRYLGATPIFIDSELDTWNMDPVILEQAIKDRLEKGKRIKAAIVVHLYGMPAKIFEIKEICKYYNIPLIEDAAEALGSKIGDKFCGSFGDIGILSFNGNKIITTSGGGALLTNNEDIATKTRFLATQARDPAPHYQHSEIGYNYRLSNVLAAIGRGQMELINERVNQRVNWFKQYRQAFAGMEGIHFLDEPEHFSSNRWLSTILVNPFKCKGISREDIRVALEAENIESRPLWKPMHLQPVFSSFPYFGDKNVSEELFQNGLCLPSGSNMTDEDLTRIIDCILKLIN